MRYQAALRPDTFTDSLILNYSVVRPSVPLAQEPFHRACPAVSRVPGSEYTNDLPPREKYVIERGLYWRIDHIGPLLENFLRFV